MGAINSAIGRQALEKSSQSKDVQLVEQGKGVMSRETNISV